MIRTTSPLALLRQLAWAATLAAGFATAWFLVVVTLTTWIQNAWPEQKPRAYESVLVRSDGSLIIQNYDLDDPSHITYHDLEGHAEGAPGSEDQIRPVSMSGEPEKMRYFTPQPDWSSRLMSFFNEQEHDVNWYSVRDGKPDGAGYFVAYNRMTNRRMGFLGMSGFRADPLPRAEWIPMHGEPTSSMAGSIFSGRAWSYYRPERWDVPPHWVYVPSGTPAAPGRPRRANRHDRFRNAGADRVGGRSLASRLVRWSSHDGTAHPGADNARDPDH